VAPPLPNATAGIHQSPPRKATVFRVAILCQFWVGLVCSFKQGEILAILFFFFSRFLRARLIQDYVFVILFLVLLGWGWHCLVVECSFFFFSWPIQFPACFTCFALKIPIQGNRIRKYPLLFAYFLLENTPIFPQIRQYPLRIIACFALKIFWYAPTSFSFNELAGNNYYKELLEK
jgi:hypothetical protein